jgi:hypothetical protein
MRPPSPKPLPDPIAVPRTLTDLRRFLHSYRIRNAGHQTRTTRASIIYGALDDGTTSPLTQRAARELADLDPSLSWLPSWKPRARVVAASQ